MKKKKCYICLPIGGQEDTVIQRAELAIDAVKKLGYYPITPLEINKETQEILNNPNRPIGKFMGNDIQVLIDECEVIYMCKGWECSKGCNVEFECANQYGKTIFYEEVPLNNGFIDVIRNRFDKLVQEYRNANEEYGHGSFDVSIIRSKIDDYKEFIKSWFNFDI